MKTLKDNQILITEIANGWILNIANPNPNVKGRTHICISEKDDGNKRHYSKIREESLLELFENLIRLYIKK